MLAEHGIAGSTRKNYGTYFKYWEDYCDWMHIPILSLNQRHALNFVAWCWKFTTLNGKLVSRALTAAGSYHKDNGISWIRKDFPAIKRHVEGFIFLRPPNKRPKLPFSEFHIQKLFYYCINLKKINDILMGTVILIGYILLLRPSELTLTKSAKTKPTSQRPTTSQPSPSKHLANNNISWYPSFNKPSEISIKVDKSKTNRHNNKLETVYASCNCNDPNRIIPCPPHMLKYYILCRNRYHRKIFRPKDDLFIKSNGDTLNYNNLNNWMHNAIVALNKRMGLKMNPNYYTPHTLRTGGCTDMARKGSPGWQIEAQGRWSTNMWKDTYINMDWKDMATLNNCTVTELKRNIVNRPYSN